MTTVPYKGTGPAMNDMMGGQVDLLCDQTTNTTGPDQGWQGQGLRRDHAGAGETLPDLPTLDEAGLKGLRGDGVARALRAQRHPAGGMDKLAGALQAALQNPKVVERFAGLGTEAGRPRAGHAGGADRHLQAEIAKWKPIIQKAGVYAD